MTGEQYFSNITDSAKLEAVSSVYDAFTQHGYTVALVSVTGSSLRGMDMPGSDIDLIVVTLESPCGKPDVDYDVNHCSLEVFLSAVSKSIPLAESLRTKYARYNPQYEAFLRGLRFKGYELEAHARSMVHSLFARQPHHYKKMVRQAFAMWFFLSYGHSMIPRKFASMPLDEMPTEFQVWLNEALS